MPPIDRMALATDEGMHASLDRFLAEVAALEMPEQARLALSAVTASGIADRHWLLENILSDRIPEDSAAPHLFVSAAVQLHLARLAGMLDAAKLVKIRTGTCPTCGRRAASALPSAPSRIAARAESRRARRPAVTAARPWPSISARPIGDNRN